MLGLCNVFAFAQTETTIDFLHWVIQNLQVLTSTTVNPITVTYVNGNTNGSKCAYYTLVTAVRIHSNNGIIVSTNSGNITKIVFTDLVLVLCIQLLQHIVLMVELLLCPVIHGQGRQVQYRYLALTPQRIIGAYKKWSLQQLYLI